MSIPHALLFSPIMRGLSEEDTAQLIADIATRAGTAKQIASWYEVTVAELREWVAENRAVLEAYRDEAESEPEASTEPDPMELSDLWITNKFERLKRLQVLADKQYNECQSGRLIGAELATGLREFRSYLALAANELGQLLHRGSGEGQEGETLQVEIPGVDMGSLK